MPRYRLEALSRSALGLHDTVGFEEFDAPDLFASCGAADSWLRDKDFDQATVSNARIMM